MSVNSLPVGIIEIYNMQRNGKWRFLLQRVSEERLNLVNRGYCIEENRGQDTSLVESRIHFSCFGLKLLSDGETEYNQADRASQQRTAAVATAARSIRRREWEESEAKTEVETAGVLNFCRGFLQCFLKVAGCIIKEASSSCHTLQHRHFL
jgi:hypothetical protein